MENYYKKYHLDDDEIKTLFENAMIVFDTSALLDFYFYSKTTVDNINNQLFEKYKGRLWIPSQVYYEFLKNKDKVSTKPMSTYMALIDKPENGNDGGHLSNIKTAVESFAKKDMQAIRNQLKTLKEKTSVETKHPVLNQKQFEKLEKLLDKVEKQINTFKDNSNNIIDSIREEIEDKAQHFNSQSDDEIKTIVDSRFEVGTELSYSEMVSIAKEGSFRYKETIPPGYEDADDKSGLQKYGDLFIWKQIIQKAKEDSNNVLFVINDVKEDWFDKKSKSPRFELLKEFNSETGKKFWSMTTKQFLYIANSSLDDNSKLSDSVIDDISEVQITKENLQYEDDLLYYKNILIDSYQELFSEDYSDIVSLPPLQEWETKDNTFLYQVKDANNNKKIILLYVSDSIKYTQVLRPFKSGHFVKDTYNELGVDVEMHQFRLTSNLDSACKLVSLLSRGQLKQVYNNKCVYSYIGYIENEEIHIIASNYAVG